MPKDDLAPAVVATMTVELVIQIIPTVGRIYVRTRLKQLFGWDDVAVILGLVSKQTGFCAEIITRAHHIATASYYRFHHCNVRRSQLRLWEAHSNDPTLSSLDTGPFRNGRTNFCHFVFLCYEVSRGLDNDESLPQPTAASHSLGSECDQFRGFCPLCGSRFCSVQPLGALVESYCTGDVLGTACLPKLRNFQRRCVHVPTDGKQ